MPDAEFTVALEKAKQISLDVESLIDINSAADHIHENRQEFRRLFGFLRGTEPNQSLMVGTAQAIDCLSYMIAVLVIVGELPGEDGLLPVLDEAVLARLSNSLESDRTRDLLESGLMEKFATAFPNLPRMIARLRAFVTGTE
jgi:hypothetical protein